MIVIIGGKYHGKYDFISNYIDVSKIHNCSEKKAITKQLILYNFQELSNHCCLETFCKQNMQVLQNKIIIGNEVGLGIVPIKAKQRRMRDDIGRAYQLLVANALVVIRIWYGIPIYIKGDETMFLKILKQISLGASYE